MRGNLGKARRLGVRLERAEPTPVFRTECAALMQAWHARRRAGTALGWVFDLDPFAWAAHKRYFLARDHGGQAAAFLAASPLPARGGWYLEDVIRRPDAPDGAAAALVAYALGELRAEGARLATLGAVPLCSPRRSDPAVQESRPLEALLYAARPLLSHWYNFDGLRQFKNQFVPSFWENEYLLLPGCRSLPSAALGLLSALLPGGLRSLKLL
ncbi:phosphatidylglycerol lysyltransferase domain-containing protein [Deinococcus alpinitundrae]|uniref:phosphatidylglycerol lysyltransferase domain-containing protein n=1 Tax=Deinococcus alpinitundrae TaxID=468913 RepID=UPI002354C7EA|nr:phosphatidylglycerol lysyltransferase domain-containing protein [Deinococcus alpinitundrae]